jgi:A/G-specific adenine glycosylase
MKQEFSALLIQWYEQNARNLPWRGHSDPYAIWVSEIMLQQTRVDTVIPYFLKWMRLFPSIDVLATASEDSVLKAWEGLGYYSRARSLHKAAHLLVLQHDGHLPNDFNLLKSLPGIGPYTAAAIASIAFGLNHAVVDGNVKRVLARLLPYTQAVNMPSAEKELRQIAQDLLPADRPGDYNQAMMELGALICLPRNPRCADCPVSSLCAALMENRQAELPVMKEKSPIPHITVTAGIIHEDGKVLIARRPASGLLGGMWEFPGGKVEVGETHHQALVRELEEELAIITTPGELFGKYDHAYTHFKVTLYAYHTRITSGEIRLLQASETRWVSVEELDAYAMGKIDRMISRDLLKGGKSNG